MTGTKPLVLALVVAGSACGGTSPSASDAKLVAPAGDDHRAASAGDTRGQAGAPVKSALASKPRLQQRADLEAALRSGGFDGVFVAHEAGSDMVTCVGGKRCTVRVSPASTFKVPHALIALDAGVLEGRDHYFPWDGKKRWLAAWNQGHTLESAIRDSVVWYFQRVARTLGQERLQRGLQRLGYGNQRIGDKIDEFWLDGSLAISPVEQVGFWQRLHDGRLDAKPTAIADVLAMTELARQSNTVLRGKTGWHRPTDGGAEHGWFAGCLDGPKRVCFATLIFPVEPFEFRDALAARIRVSRAMLSELGYMVPEP